MVTSKAETQETFAVEIRQGRDGIVRVLIENEKGESRLYQSHITKLSIFASMNPAIRDAVDFLLGDA